MYRQRICTARFSTGGPPGRKKQLSTAGHGPSKRQRVDGLKPGDQVVFQNLKEDVDFNGKSGKLVRYDSSKSRWLVKTELDSVSSDNESDSDDERLMLFKAENLKRKDQNDSASDQDAESTADESEEDGDDSDVGCPTHVYVLILEEWNHGWGSGQESKVIGVYISKEAAVLASGDINTSYGTFDKAIEPNRGDFSGEFDHKDYRNNPPDDGILIQLGGDDIGEGDYIRLKIQKMPLLQ